MVAIPIIVLLAVIALIAVRQIGSLKLQIWQIMLLGALAVLITGQISPLDALNSINPDVMLFLFGMFVVGKALEESGYLSHLSYELFRRARSVDSLVLLILFTMGSASAFLMNDTIAIIGTPVVIFLASKHKISPKLMLLALAFAVTIGSVMSPIGNPQNLLIAVGGGVAKPFVIFFRYLALPTVINLFIAYLMLKCFFKREFHSMPLSHSREPIRDKKLAMISKVSLILVAALVVAKIIIVSLFPQVDFRLTYIALVSAAPVIIFSSRRLEIIRHIDWHTLIFFASMFVLMESVWDTGFFQLVIDKMNLSILSVSTIIVISILLSQFISNVPLVALYLPMLKQAGALTKELVALAAGSTIAGNLSILGAASNVIIIQNAERSGKTLSFIEFVKVGAPLTALNAFVYWFFLSFC